MQKKVQTWKVTHQITCIGNTHDLQPMININNNSLLKNLFVRLHMHYFLKNIKALKSSNTQEEEKLPSL